MTRPLSVSRAARGQYNVANRKRGDRNSVVNARVPLVRDLLLLVEQGQMTDRAIVDKAGVAHNMLSNLRLGKSVQIHNLIAIAQAMGWYAVWRRNPDTEDKQNG